jgi:hypothetical protein
MEELRSIVNQANDWRSELNEIKALLLINHMRGNFFPWDEQYREMSTLEHFKAVVIWQAERIRELEEKQNED